MPTNTLFECTFFPVGRSVGGWFSKKWPEMRHRCAYYFRPPKTKAAGGRSVDGGVHWIESRCGLPNGESDKTLYLIRSASVWPRITFQLTNSRLDSTPRWMGVSVCHCPESCCGMFEN